MRKLLFACGLWWLGQLLTLQAQVTTNPATFTADQQITITYNAAQSPGNQLVGASGVKMHAGVITTGPTGTTWEYVVGQWGNPASPGTMTSLGNNQWSITITPRTYFNVPNNVPIYRIGMVFRGNGPCGGFGGSTNPCPEGKATNGGDIFVNVTQPIAFDAATTALQFVNNGQNVTVVANASAPANLALFLNNVQIATANNATTISANINVTNATTKYRLRATATPIGGGAVQEANTYFVLRQTPVTQAVPTGMRNGVNYNPNDPTKATLVLTAPQKAKVYVVGEFNNWELDPAYLMRRTADGNRNWVEISGLTAGQEYAYQYWIYDGSEARVVTGDPYAELILDQGDDPFIPASIYPNLKPYPTGKTTGKVSVLQTGQTPFAWSSATLNFQKPNQRNLVIYELWVYDFSPTRDFQGVIDKLDYLKSLGVNVIELMPIMEFSGNISWGYNPNYYCAVDKAYGTRNKLKELIDECHKRGMAIVLDMVLNHAQEDYPYVAMYPLNSNPYFNAQPTHPFNVFRDFNHDSQFTKEVVKEVNEYWLREYKFDGYRFDLSKGFTQNTQCGGSTSDVNCWNQYNADRVATWKRIADEIWAVDPTAYVMLEHLSVDSEEAELAAYRANEGKGMLFWQNMEANYAENVMGFNGGTANISRLDFENRGFSVPHSIAYMESHDEERIMYKARNFGNQSQANYNVRNVPIGLERMKAAAAMLFPTPGPKMLWQFNEFGFDFSINYCPNGTINNNCRTDAKPQPWVAPQNYDTDPNRIKLRKVFSEIIKLKTSYDVFRSNDVFVQSSQGGNQYRKMIKVTHQPYTTTPANANQMNVVIIANFDVVAQSVTADFHHAGTWYDFFDASSVSVPSGSLSQNYSLQPGEFRIFTNFQLPAPEAELTAFVKPLAPGNVSATALSATQIQLDWTDASTIETGFRILRSTAANGTFAQVGTVAAGVTTFTDTGLTGNTQYFYRIEAVSASGKFAQSATVSATTLNAGANPPSNLTATSNATGTRITLTWTDNSSDESGFKVQRSTTSGTGFVDLTTLAANTTSYNDDAVVLNTTYFYRVCATKAGAGDACSAQASATAQVSPPAAPTNLVAVNNTNDKSIRLTWTDNATDENGYIVQRTTTSGSGYTTIATLGAGANNYTDNDATLVIGTTYFYRVCATKINAANACSGESSPIVSAMEDNLLSRFVRISPNPVEGKMQITMDENYFPAGGVVVLTDGLGRVLNTTQISAGENILDCSTLPAGLYFLQMRTEKGTTLKRVVKK